MIVKRSKNGDTVSLASAVPYRQGDSGIEFCLITTRKSGRWGFPKGRVAKKQSLTDTALREAMEEAGLQGRIVGEPLGDYCYSKNETQHAVVALLMEVEACLDDWDESSVRDRRWTKTSEALELLERPNLVELLETAVLRIQRELT